MPDGLYAFIWETSRSRQIWLGLLTFVLFPLSLAPLELQRRIVNNAVGGKDIDLLILLCGLFAIVLVANGGTKFVRNVYLGRTVEISIRHLRGQIACAARTENRSVPGDGDQPESGAYVSMVAAEAEKLGGFVGESISYPLLQLGILASILGYMAWIEPLIAVVALAVLVPQAVLVPHFQNRINRHAELRTELLRELGVHLVEGKRDGVNGDREPAAIDATIGEIFHRRIRIYYLKYVLKFLTNVLGSLGPLGILSLGGWLVIQGETEVGTIVAFLSGFERILQPSRELLSFYRNLSNTRVQYELFRQALLPAGA